ncbi:MAG: hypothetical protein WBE20_16365 [Candidatus Acidiferrales bacterium]
MKVHKLRKPRWRKLRGGAWYTDLGGKLPDMAILCMSNAEFKKFHASRKIAMKYVDRRRILKRNLIKLVFGSVVPNGSDNCWIVMIAHTLESTAVITAWQG